jgi:hypothetical protein
MSGYALINASRTPTNYFDAMQRPSNQGDLDSCVTGEFGSLLHGGGSGSDFLYRSTAVHDCCWVAF